MGLFAGGRVVGGEGGRVDQGLGVDRVAALERDQPHVLLSDIAMPGEDGYALLRTIRELGIPVPAIALTAYARREDAASALAAGFQCHIPKPVDRAALIAAVGSLAETTPELDARTA